jgi:hypothetical protein
MKMLARPQQPAQPGQQLQNPQVAQIQQMFGVDYNTALQLMKMMSPGNAAAAPLPQMQYGGRPTGPTIVGEAGPEIFTPDVPGTISPMLPIPTDDQIRAATQTGPYWGSFEHTWGEIPRAIDRVPFNDAAWEKYLRAQPRSRNVEDRRNETLSDEERDRARYFDFPLGSTRPMHRK